MAGSRKGTKKQRYQGRKAYYNAVIPERLYHELKQLSEAHAVSISRLINRGIELVVTNPKEIRA